MMDDIDTLGVYLHQIGEHALLTKHDEVRLAQTIEAGRDAAVQLEAETDRSARYRLRRKVRAGKAAHDEFVQANLRLVVSVAHRIRRTSMRDVPVEDLIQEGNIGLMHAVDKFDWRKGYKFSTYATWWITQAIGRHQRFALHLPTNHVPHVHAVRAGVAAGVDLGDVAAERGVSVDIVEGIARCLGVLSLDRPVTEHSETMLADLLPGSEWEDEWVDHAAVAAELGALLDHLTPEQRTLMGLVHGLDGVGEHTIAEAAEALGVGFRRAQWLSQAARRTLRRLRDEASDTDFASVETA